MATGNKKSTAKPKAEKPEIVEEPTAEVVTTYSEPVQEEIKVDEEAPVTELPRDFELPEVEKEELTLEAEKVVFAEDVVPPQGEPLEEVQVSFSPEILAEIDAKIEESKCDLTLPIEAPFIPVLETKAPEQEIIPVQALSEPTGLQTLAKIEIPTPVVAPVVEQVLAPAPAPAPAPRVKKSFAQMTASEFNIYMKTGIIPFL